MPYKDPETKRKAQAVYRERNREQLASAERERRAALKKKDPEGFAIKEKIRRNIYRDRHRHTEEYKRRARESAKRNYDKKSKDPEFRRKNTERARQWVKQNRERANATWRAIKQRRTHSDVQYRLSQALRRRFYMALKGEFKSGSAIDMLGCSIEELKQHLQNQFVDGMTWENWGPDGWHIDHIKPLSSFDLTDQEQVAKACHYSNLQPLWARENEAKGARAA